MALISVVIGGITIAIGTQINGTNTAMETPRLAFANPYLACVMCGRRAVACVDPTYDALTSKLKPSATNWPCYHANGRLTLCDNWTPTTGCQHDAAGRAAHGRPRDTDMNQQGQVPR